MKRTALKHRNASTPLRAVPCTCCFAPAVCLDPATNDPFCQECLRKRVLWLRRITRLARAQARGLFVHKLFRHATF